jgi:hypothetical protein
VRPLNEDAIVGVFRTTKIFRVEYFGRAKYHFLSENSLIWEDSYENKNQIVDDLLRADDDFDRRSGDGAERQRADRGSVA